MRPGRNKYPKVKVACTACVWKGIRSTFMQSNRCPRCRGVVTAAEKIATGVRGTPTLPLEGKAQDDCEVCHGTKGGVRGNENIVDGKVICDYCHAEHLTSKAQDEDLPDRFGELPERTRPSIFDGQPPLTEEDKRGYSKEQWAEIIAENSGGLDGVEAGGAAGEDRRTVEAVSKGDDGVESGAVGVGEKKGVDG